MPKKSSKNPDLKASENPEPKATENPEQKVADKPQPKPRKRTARKLPAVADSVPADAPEQKADEPELHARSADASTDPVAEARTQAEAEAKAAAADTFEQAFEDSEPPHLHEPVTVDVDQPVPEPATMAGEHEVAAREPSMTVADADKEAGFTPEPRPPAKLERLQKILSQAGVASRRHAEELITEGRVQVNGKVITELGSKADAGRDHIRVDGKLLQGAARLRYFMLNKPKGYVTTVSDPEGRPTVMQIFSKMNERLYPVGRLDYQSEGLLLVTNDGDLANKLTKAATGVEKTYLVKVSGRPSEEELDLLREGVSIDRTRPGEGRVQTAPASIRQVRQGDNPWYEVVLIEGRNRELRKMFEEIGHFVEKIRRVGYGPLVLDQEPGQFRELEPEELVRLRQAAEGKLRRPKARTRSRGIPKREALPEVPAARAPHPPSEERRRATGPSGQFASKRPPRPGRDWERPRDSRPARPANERSRPAGERFRPAGGPRDEAAQAFELRQRPPARPGPGAAQPARFGQQRTEWKKDDRGARSGRFNTGTGRRTGGPGTDRRAPYRGSRPETPSKPVGQARTGPARTGRTGSGRSATGRGFDVRGGRPYTAGGDRPRPPRPATGRPQRGPVESERPRFDSRSTGRAEFRPGGSGRVDSARPNRGAKSESQRPGGGSVSRPMPDSGPARRGPSEGRSRPSSPSSSRSGFGRGSSTGSKSSPRSGSRGSGGRPAQRPGGNRPGKPGRKRP